MHFTLAYPPLRWWAIELRRFATPRRTLPVKLHGKLELARIIRRGRLAGVAEQRAHRCHIHLVRDVKHIGDQVHAEALAEINPLGETHVVEDRPRLNSRIAAQVAVKLQQSGKSLRGDESVDARFLEGSGRRVLAVVDSTAGGVDRGVGAACQRRQLGVVATSRNDKANQTTSRKSVGV